MYINIINRLLVLCIGMWLVAACQTDKKKLLCQQWKTIHLKNSTLDKEITQMKAYIDTIGQNDPELRASVNIDSAKHMLQAELTQALKEQKLSVENTLMEFKSNGVAYTTSIDGIDSALFTMEDDFIKIDEAKLKGYGESMTFEVLLLQKDTLRLRLVDYGDTSIITMIPVK